MKGYTAGTVYRRESETPYIEIWEQSSLRWLIAEAYQLWENYSFYFMMYVSKWHKKFFGKNEDYIPLLNRQDIRNYYLTNKKRTVLAIIYTTQDQYDIVTGKTTKEEEPRHEVREPISPEPLTQE